MTAMLSVWLITIRARQRFSGPCNFPGCHNIYHTSVRYQLPRPSRPLLASRSAKRSSCHLSHVRSFMNGADYRRPEPVRRSDFKAPVYAVSRARMSATTLEEEGRGGNPGEEESGACCENSRAAHEQSSGVGYRCSQCSFSVHRV